MSIQPPLTLSLPASHHPESQDALLHLPHPADPACLLLFLADGHGGRAGGARAARLACRSAADAACACDPSELASPTDWSDLLRRADAAVHADTDAGFTTLVGLCLYRGFIAGASCGDSMALLVSPHHRTVDLTAQQQKHPP